MSMGGDAAWTRVSAKLEAYGRRSASQVRLQPLLKWWPKSRRRKLRVLDVGCGTGHELNYISRLHPNTELIGVDNDASALASDVRVAIEFHRSLTTATGDSQYDIAMCIHTLHHIEPSEQAATLHAIAHAVSIGGLVYLFEDTWSRVEQFRSRYRPALSRQFIDLSDNSIRLLFSANDHWSNAWCYGRRLHIAARAYRKLEHWLAVLPPILRVIDAGVDGFNPRRLHGVPSGWVVAQRAANE